jgi:hypothetical protein
MPRRPQDQGRQHFWIDSQEVYVRINTEQTQGRTTGYLWIFTSPMKLRFQQTKNQVNQRFLQADMA